jgi:hypothetical protein
VTSIGQNTFADCTNLEDVYCYAENVPSAESNTFSNSYINFATLHVPETAIDNYSTTSPWSGFGTFVALDGSPFHEMTISVGTNGKVTYGTSNITNTSQTFNVKEGSDVTLTLTPNSGYRLSSVTVNDVDKTADVSEGTLLISNVTADVTVTVRFVLDGDVASLTITDAGVATFCSDKDLDFSDVAGVKAYTGAGFNTSTGKLVLLEVTDVPAGTGLLVKGAAGSYEIPSKASASIYANLLVGVTTATSLSQTDGGYTNYILGKKSDVVGFYKVDGSGGDLPAGKAYLRIPTSAAGARTAIALDFSGDTSGIDDIGADSTQREAWFDLQGRRLEAAPVKAGLYIRNGKKFIVH